MGRAGCDPSLHAHGDSGEHGTRHSSALGAPLVFRTRSPSVALDLRIMFSMLSLTELRTFPALPHTMWTMTYHSLVRACCTTVRLVQAAAEVEDEDDEAAALGVIGRAHRWAISHRPSGLTPVVLLMSIVTALVITEILSS